MHRSLIVISVLWFWGVLMAMILGRIENYVCTTSLEAEPPSCPRSKFCPCTPPCKCAECRCGGVLPAPGTPLLTVVIHDGQARIAWIDEGGQRQERTLTEAQFAQLNAESE